MFKKFISKLSLCFLLLSSHSILSYGQQALPIDATQSCSYFGEHIKDNLYEFRSSNEANQVINQIMGVVGLKSRFEIKAANVPNAAAVIYNSKRYILYSQNFISTIHRATQTDFAAISILAHEIGHHLNGHTLEYGGSRPSHELEADEFSGFVLRKMGASLPQAQAAMRILADETGSETHPPKSARLEAIAAGWKQADESIPSDATARNEQSNGPSDSTYPQDNTYPQEDQEVQTRAETNSTPVDKKYLVGKVVFDTSPGKDYYLTTGLNLITVTEDSIEVVGKLTKTEDEDYPYRIYNKNNKYVYIASNGTIYNANSEKIGYTTHI